MKKGRQARHRIPRNSCFGFSGPLRQHFSLYRAVSQREGEREERIEESKNVQTTPTRTYCKRNRPLPYYHPNCRTPRHWKFSQDHRTARPLPTHVCVCVGGGTRKIGTVASTEWLDASSLTLKWNTTKQIPKSVRFEHYDCMWG